MLKKYQAIYTTQKGANVLKGTLNGLAKTYLSQFGYIASEEIQLRKENYGDCLW